LIYVVNSCDRERITESQRELFEVLDSPEMRGVPVLVIANKQDLPGAMKVTEISDLMTLHKIASRDWFIQAASATNGEGIIESMIKMDNMVKEYRELS
ncbi:ADP-ribosylation factor 1-like, partial [Saccostrea cucullata]|uniref:ADP-ribosylation factor 1-like n=1 Tax=Saccostrea cuccullata TaxID=36930 RepID=UPI002ED4B9F0